MKHDIYKNIDQMDSLTTQQLISIKLMQNDFRFLYTVIMNAPKINSNYITCLLPYLGLIVDGAEDWIKAFNNSHKDGFHIPTYSPDEQDFYEKMRNTIKIWNEPYEMIYARLEQKYHESDIYFSNLCKPIAKALKLYNIYGVDIVHGKYCGNTILCSLFTPNYEFGRENGDEIKRLSGFAGYYTAFFNALQAYSLNDMDFHTVDYGGFRKSPFGNEFSDRFVLFSLLCQVNFVLKCVIDFIADETTTKLRFAYILYYYVTNIVPEINNKLNTEFTIDDTWHNKDFRNSMAHYKIGMVLNHSDIIPEDPFFGLVQKHFNLNYHDLKLKIVSELMSISDQLERHLNIPSFLSI